MSTWLAIGVFLLGAGMGALLTTIAYHGRDTQAGAGRDPRSNHDAAQGSGSLPV